MVELGVEKVPLTGVELLLRPGLPDLLRSIAQMRTAYGSDARREEIILHFIEFMPLEEGRIWSAETVATEAEIIERINRVAPLRNFRRTA